MKCLPITASTAGAVRIQARVRQVTRREREKVSTRPRHWVMFRALFSVPRRPLLEISVM